jgi:hypothetical protein
VKLVDFGIARRSVDAGLTSAGYIIGTPPYMAPETLMAKPHTPVADVYAVGATLYELLTGGAPFGNGRLHEVMSRALQEPVAVPPELAGTALAELLLAMLDKDESRRPDAMQVRNALERIQDELAAARIASGASLTAPAPPPATVSAAPGPVSRDQATIHLTPRPTAQGTVGGGSTGSAPAPDSGPVSGSSSQRGSGGAMGTAPTALAPAGATGQMAGGPAPSPPTRQASTRQATVSSPAAQRRHLWLWLGPLLAIPLLIAIVTLTLVFGGFGRSNEETDPSDAEDGASGEPPRTAAMAPAGARRRTRQVASRRRRRRPPARDPVTSGRVLGKACKSQRDAKRFFARAKAADTRTRAGQDEALRYYRAVLNCGYAYSGQRRWAARLMSNIYRNRRACRSSRALWRTYQRLTRAVNKRPKPYPGCP